MLCIFSLPGESASRDRVVNRPYTTAHAAHTRATTTPWLVRKLLNRNPPRSVGVPREDFARTTSSGRIVLLGAPIRRKGGGSLSCRPAGGFAAQAACLAGPRVVTQAMLCRWRFSVPAPTA